MNLVIVPKMNLVIAPKMNLVILRRAYFARRRIWASRAMRRVLCDA
jgi:hypothetical protein